MISPHIWVYFVISCAVTFVTMAMRYVYKRIEGWKSRAKVPRPLSSANSAV